MKEPLEIDFSSTISYFIQPSEKLKKNGEELLSITDLGERLQYYNKHICSLCYSYPREGLRCYGQYTHWKGHGTVFLQKRHSGNDPDFERYLQERQKEIDRLKNLISKQDNYYEKLKCFIEQKAGQIRFDELKIEDNEWERFLANGAGAIPRDLEDDHTEINLQPSTPDEVKSYNKYVRDHVYQLFYNTEEQSWLIEDSYCGFRALPAMDIIREQVLRAFNKDITIKTELNRVEAKFKCHHFANYIDFLYPYSIDNLSLWQAALFNALLNGHQYDYSRRILTVHEMKALIHVEEVFLYYKYVHLLGTNIVYGSFKELFQEAVGNGILSELKDSKKLPVQEALYNYLFNRWLQDRRGWKYGDENEYKMLLIQKEFEQFVRAYKAEEQTRKFLIGYTNEDAHQIYQQNFQWIRECFQIKRKVSKEDSQRMARLKEGDIIAQDPPFATSTEAFALLTGYYAPEYMELEKQLFIEKYKTWNEATIQSEIAEIELFIAEANKQSLSEACKAFNKWGTDTDAFIYLRLKSGFYEYLEVGNYPIINSIGNKEACIYGKYFLFYDFLKTQFNSQSGRPQESLIRNSESSLIENRSKSNTDIEPIKGEEVTLQNVQNNFDEVDMKAVYRHFKEGLVAKKYLAEADLLPYLKAAFEDMQAPSNRFNFINAPKKENIMQVFYLYYTNIAGKPHGKQRKYAALLGDYFKNYNTPTVSTNFSKSVY